MSLARSRSVDGYWRARLFELAQDWRFPTVFLFAFSVIVRFVEIDRAPHVDELYHVMAAQGWLVYGEPRIADGLYPRAELFTALVAGSLKIFGDNLVAARLPSVVAGSLLVVAVFLWTRRVAGPAAAWIAALLLCLSSLSFQLFLWARLYALHALAFWLGAIGIYALFEEPLSRWRRLGVVLGAGAALLLAHHLQPVTQIGLAAIAVWFGLAHALPWVWTGERWRVLVALGGFLLLVIAAIGSWNLLAELWQVYRWAPPHSLEHRNEFWFYHLLLLNRYPAVWPFFPLVAIIALAAKPRPALFCLCMFVLVFVLESFGGMKDQRYLFFAMPFLYALCGMALAQILGPLWRWLNAATDRAATALLPSAWRRPAKWLALGASALFLIGANGSTAKTALMFAGVRLSADGDGIGIGQEHDGDAWSAASAPLEPWLEQASLVMTMGEEFTLYYLGDYDILIDRNRVVELGDHEFIVDPRNGRPIVSKPSSVQRILNCYPDGVIIVDSKIWRQPNRVGDAVADLIEERTTRIDLPTTSRIVLYRWERSGATEVPADCADLPNFPSGSSG